MAPGRFPAHLEYKRDPDLSKDSVTALLEWAHSQLHLPKISEEDAILFLASCNHDMDQAKYTIDAYYTFRTNTPEFFQNMDPLEESSALCMKNIAIQTLPGTTDEGYKVICTHWIDADPAQFDFGATVKCVVYHKDIALYQEGAVKGICFIVDLQGGGIRHWTKVSISSLKKMLFYFQNAMPARLQSINFINPVFFMDVILALVKPFLNPATAELIFVHNKIEDLHKVIPRRMLPRELGGHLEYSFEELQESNNNRIIENRDILKNGEEMRVEESLRPKIHIQNGGGFLSFRRFWSSGNEDTT